VALQRLSGQAMITQIHDEFERRGWRDPGQYPVAIVEHMRVGSGRLDPVAAARIAPKRFLLTNGITRDRLCDALAQVGADRQLLPEPSTPGVTVNNTFNVTGDNNNISNVNVGDQIITLQSSKADSLKAVEWLVREALAGNVHEHQLRDLGQQLQARDDIVPADIEHVTGEVIAQEAPDQTRLQKMRDSLMTSAASGLLVQTIVAVANGLLS
jgi:hypothetical protein